MSRSDSMSTFAVNVTGLCRSFRGRPALDDIDLQIPVGSIFGLVGLNGAGKTTLIRHLIGAFVAQQGTVRVLGMDPVADSQSVLRRVGYLSEEDSMPSWMRVGELVDFSRAIYDTWDDAYATKLMDEFGLSRMDKLSSLSKGLRARAGLLVAIAYRPELLILDEPSSGLDPLARRDILEAIIRTISDEGRTVLFSSHLLDEVDRVCDSIALMRASRIIETTTVDQLQSRYEEIVCRSDTESPPAIRGVFDWQRDESEWSGVVDRQHASGGEVNLPVDVALISRRPVTLHRWFAARAGTVASTASESTDGNSSEVTSHVG
ncbi:ABC transporter ATP binding protein [Rhodopirellula maiorica SM1]|uniref:ABC transporter ATP binding protein n=2 Tax=Novipirellula TaxID=2795426 RepID=M5RL30_9BACT|nr:ABC transporter ATP binding protein [Rhodopirellula maiorica SM1]